MNTNCLENMACSDCGYEDAFFIEVTGIRDGDSSESTFTVEMNDDGFDFPLTDGHTDWDDDSSCRCVQCGKEGVVRNFRRS